MSSSRNSPRKPAPKKPRRTRRLRNTATGEMAFDSFAIPTWWLNTLVGIFLLPIVGLLAQSLFTSFHREAVQNAFWATEEFWFFGLGAALWALAFGGGTWVCGEPRPLRVYVFGHELTHAIWVWAMGGRVSEFKVRRDGGYILTDKHNLWIALAPYFYPVYSVAVVIVYAVASLFYDMAPFTPVLFGLLGATWSFHMTFTIWMIPKGQSDLTTHGTFFSLVIICLMNLILLIGFLIMAAPEVTFAKFGLQLLGNTEDFAEWVWQLLGAVSRRLARLL